MIPEINTSFSGWVLLSPATPSIWFGDLLICVGDRQSDLREGPGKGTGGGEVKGEDGVGGWGGWKRLVLSQEVAHVWPTHFRKSDL